jgi:hypothetical protein
MWQSIIDKLSTFAVVAFWQAGPLVVWVFVVAAVYACLELAVPRLGGPSAR